MFNCLMVTKPEIIDGHKRHRVIGLVLVDRSSTKIIKDDIKSVELIMSSCKPPTSPPVYLSPSTQITPTSILTPSTSTLTTSI
jgi:hypothetical protein